MSKLDHEQTKQMAAMAKAQESSAKTQASIQEKELRFQVLQIALATMEKVQNGTLDGNAEDSVIRAAEAYMKFIG